MATGFMKRISWIVIVLAGVMLAAGLAVTPALAETGTCGEGVTYVIDQGTLTISKTGEGTGVITKAFVDSSDYVNAVVIEDGVTAIGANIFAELGNLKSVTIPESVRSIGSYAFYNCQNLSNIVYGGSEAQWNVVPKGEKWDGGKAISINFAKLDVTITAKPQTYIYNGKQQGEGDTAYEDQAEISEKVEVSGLRSGDSITSITLDGEQTEVGVYEGADGIVPSNARINGKSEDESDYVITYIPGKLTIEAAPAEEYTVTFANWDGTVLQSGKVAKGETPKYEGAEPTRPATAQYEYLFAGWDPEVVAVTSDVTYTAKYDETSRLFTVIWQNYDGTEFYRDVKVPYGTMPKFEGAEPTRPSDESYTYAFAGWEPTIAAVTGDATYTAKFTTTPKLAYKVVSGASGTWTQGSNTPLVFKIERTVDPETAFSHFTGVQVDGKAVSEKDASGKANWTAKSGSVIVELQPSYLSTLSAGKHTVTVTFDDADPVSADFTVSAKAATPSTGDPLLGASAALLAVALLALGVLAVSVTKRRVRG